MKNKLYIVFAVVLGQISPLLARTPITYTDDAPYKFSLDKPSLKIVQFTDLHLAYGFDANDRKTLKLIKDITLETKPDLVVFTGDQTLSISAPARYRQLIRHMEKLNTPWTMVFGNHENDFHSFDRIINAINTTPSQNLFFKLGPALNDGGYGNFSFNYYYDNNPFYNLYFLDSKTELKHKQTALDLSKYEYFSEAQVAWFKDKVTIDKGLNIKSTVFTHIPLVQYTKALEDPYESMIVGTRGEGVYSQGRDTLFYQAMKDSEVSTSIFVGHDHKNNFTLNYDGILLGYGQASGYNGYGNLNRGARVIEIDETQTLETYIIYGDLTCER